MVNALKGLIDSLSAAPTWLAVFAAGLIIVWVAGNTLPRICEPFADDGPVCGEGHETCASAAAADNVSSVGTNLVTPPATGNASSSATNNIAH